METREWFHPHRFSDLYPQQLFQEYLTKFMRVDIDLEKQGYSSIQKASVQPETNLVIILYKGTISIFHPVLQSSVH